MQAFRNPTGSMRTLNLLVLMFFVTTFYAPSALAIKTGIEDHLEQKELESTLPQNQDDTALYAHKLKLMKGHFAEAERLYGGKKGNAVSRIADVDNAVNNGGSLFVNDERWKVEMQTGMTLASEAIALNALVDKDFASIKDWITAKGLPDLFLERHAEAYGEYETRYNDFLVKLEPLKNADTEDEEIAALKEINKYLADQQFGRKHQAYDPNNLGHSKPASAEGKPLLLTKEDYFRNGIDSNPRVQVAQAGGGFDFSQLPGADDPAFLAESDEVVISQMIVDQATELENDPVQIYHWVRNNIETIPGWGSYQNSELTLGARRGNPFDVASLTIALLRAAGIPSRYVMGVAEVEAEQYRNWIGDFENADIAADYAVANGIAIQAVTSGGEIIRIRTQHIWVQAAIDYFPSRGAKNRSADAWVSLDPSFKQYEYGELLDVIEASGMDLEASLTQFVETGVIDENAGYIQNLDATEFLNASQQAQLNLQQFIESNSSEFTAGEFAGDRRTIMKDYPALPSGLPFIEFSQGVTFASVPSNLQNKAAVGFNGERTVFPFSIVNNKKVTLQFTPATEADEVALDALLPGAGSVDISQLPTSIPSFLISVIPELTLNGEVFRKGSVLRLGDEVSLSYQFSGPVAVYAPYNYNVVAGSYLNVPLVAQSVSRSILLDLESRIENTRSIVLNGDQSEVERVTNQELLGDVYYAAGLAYFAQSMGLSSLVNFQLNGSTQVVNGYGSFGYQPNVNIFFGIPRGTQTGGIDVNMLFLISAESQTGDTQERNLLRFLTGLISSMLEHRIPEEMFGDPENPTQGFSAVRALELAANQGQRIFQIDSGNLSSIMPQLNLDFTVENDIRDSVNAGQIVVTHTDDVAVPGYVGAGYLILDPGTLLGSYRISGGSNGGAFDLGEILTVLIYLASAIGGAIDGFRGEGVGPRLIRILTDAGKRVLAVGLVFTAIALIADDSLVGSQIIGQFSVNLLGAAFAGIAAGFIGGLALSAVVTAVLALVAALIIAILFNAAALYFFSWIYSNKRERGMFVHNNNDILFKYS